MIEWRILTSFLLVIGNILRAEGIFLNVQNDSYYGTENCVSLSGEGIVGLRPDTASNDCRKFHWCRVTGAPTQYDPVPLQAVAFLCPNKEEPFYKAETCECVRTDEHCGENNLYLNNCVRRYVSGEPEETCQSFRDERVFYEELMPRFNHPEEFWSCAHNDHPMYKTRAYRLNCTEDLTFDMRSCKCGYVADQVMDFNNNPMNRYECARVFRD